MNGEYWARLGASLSYADKCFEKKIQEAKDLSFDCLDFDLCAYWYDSDRESIEYKNIENRLDVLLKSGIKLNGIHISFGPQWEPSVLDDNKRKENIKRVIEIINRTKGYKPYCYIFHPSQGTISDEERRERLTNAENSIFEIANHTSAKFCIEILPRCGLYNTSDEALQSIKLLNARNKNIMLCVDVNHFLKEKSEDAVAKLIDYTATMHISDHDYIDERHLLPGKGKIDWMKLIEVLDKSNYSGSFNYEVGIVSYKDIRDNYDELFRRYNSLKGI